MGVMDEWKDVIDKKDGVDGCESGSVGHRWTDGWEDGWRMEWWKR